MNEDWICLDCGKWNCISTLPMQKPNHCIYCRGKRLKPLPDYIPETQICRWMIETGNKVKFV